MILVRNAGLEQQSNEQKKAQTLVPYSLFKVQWCTIHPVGSFCGLATGILPDFHREPILYYLALHKMGRFPPYFA
jgi:hypothetical protein